MITKAELDEMESYSVSAWYYPAAKPEGERNAREDLIRLIQEIRLLQIKD